jgi:hypothetical protein
VSAAISQGGELVAMLSQHAYARYRGVVVEAGNIYLPHPMFMPWVADFLKECAAFPKGAHDDQVDAMTQILLRWHKAPAQTIVFYNEPVRISAF